VVLRRAVLAVSAALLVTACSGDGTDEDISVTPVTLPTVTAEPDVFPGRDWTRHEQGSWGDLDADLRRNGSTCVAVVRDGELVHDGYWNGGSQGGRQRVYSITKSLTSLLVGMAADEGLVRLDETASSKVDEWQDGPARDVTPRDLLSMTSGRHWDDATDRQMIRTEPDKTSYAVGLPQDHEPGDTWVYDNSAVQTLESLLDDILPADDVADLAQDHLLDPLGMTDTTWSRDPAGNALTFSGVESTCLDLARVGHLMLRQGEWNGTQLVSKDYVAAATRPSSELNAAFGLLWWTNAEGRVVEVLRQAGFATDKPPYEGRLAPNVPDDAFWAFGYGNQYIAIVPSEDLVAVRLGARPASPDRVTFDTFTRAVLVALR
jgi:CubicO group peptidase (beta-lactamase class C family)